MSETYRIHFGYSKRSRYCPQAIELAHLAEQYEVLGDGEDAWHIATLTDEQIDLMAALYVIAVKVPLPKVYGADIQYTYAYCLSGGSYNYAHASDTYKKRVYSAVERLQRETGKSIKELAEYLKDKYLHPIEQDMSRTGEKLRSESRIDYIDLNTQAWVRAENRPQEPVHIYKQIRELVAAEKYTDAVNAYYQSLGVRYYSELTKELIYLKRLAQSPLTGRDLLYFRSQSSRKGLVELKLAEYVSCIDEVLGRLKEFGQKQPLEVLLEYAPTMEQVIAKRKHDWHKGVYLWGGEFKRDSTPVTLDSFSAKFDSCPEGRLFNRYPDQVQWCRVFEYHQAPEYIGLWTTCSPSYYQTDILEKGLHLNGIEACRHKLWREYRGKWRRDPDFTSLKSLDEVSKADYTTHGIEYTGRVHTINGQDFYEINLLRELDGAKEIENPFLELVGEILREAENLLREENGLPHIGEGWVSETQLYRLVLSFFPDAEQHATPEWLRPQHLDVFVPSRKVAFEYQGRQHFEPVDFFGGEESFRETVRRDKLKAQKCKANSVTLVEWIYTETIDLQTLIKKLKQAKVDVT
jgi:hypothetical protein